mmetsp:Transcript_17510/g.27599  ORF Transcript_17510/g.27599 Transcript_17510/m.27599 type:complete len:105 (-) Transcript_17510:177-491(-)
MEVLRQKFSSPAMPLFPADFHEFKRRKEELQRKLSSGGNDQSQNLPEGQQMVPDDKRNASKEMNSTTGSSKETDDDHQVLNMLMKSNQSFHKEFMEMLSSSGTQ